MMSPRYLVALVLLVIPLMSMVPAAESNPFARFKAGFASADITPDAPVPLWGYGRSLRPDNISTGIHDPLYAKVLVLEADGDRLALVGLDLGRPPFEPSVRRLQIALRQKAGIDHLFLVASHTHHGPALELVPVEGAPEAPLKNAMAYYDDLEKDLEALVVKAASNLVGARIGWISGETAVNRNRHTDQEPVPRESELMVLRVDTQAGEPIALAVNMAAHPTNHPPANTQFSADFPGVMMEAVEDATGVPTMFLQGAAGDMQCDVDDSQWGKVDQMEQPGTQLAREVIALHDTLETRVPEHPDIRGMEKTFSFPMRLDLEDAAVTDGMRAEFGESLYASYRGKYSRNIMHPKLFTVLINGELAIAAGSGEYFSDLSVQFKKAVRGPEALFLGYCNGHDMYFPTERAVEQGGYGADPASAWIEVGAPEQIMERAVWDVQELIRTFTRDRRSPEE